MQINRFATFNRKLLRNQLYRVNSIRNLNKQNEIEYHKQFNKFKTDWKEFRDQLIKASVLITYAIISAEIIRTTF